jgi:hypothetical protein
MKILFTLIALFVLSLSVTSCKKKSEDPAPNSTTNSGQKIRWKYYPFSKNCDSGYVYIYDNNGNLTSKTYSYNSNEGESYTYNGNQQLSSYTYFDSYGSTSNNIFYDANNRISQIVSHKSTYNDSVYFDYSNSNQISIKLKWGGTYHWIDSFVISNQVNNQYTKLKSWTRASSSNLWNPVIEEELTYSNNIVIQQKISERKYSTSGNTINVYDSTFTTQQLTNSSLYNSISANSFKYGINSNYITNGLYQFNMISKLFLPYIAEGRNAYDILINQSSQYSKKTNCTKKTINTLIFNNDGYLTSNTSQLQNNCNSGSTNSSWNIPSDFMSKFHETY